MRLLIFGLAVSSSWGNGHATVWRGLCGALGRAGHCITFFERDVPYYRSHRDLLGTENYEICLYQDWSDIEAPAVRALQEADCAIVTSYCPDARRASDLILDSPRPLHVFYDLDTPVTLNVLGRQGEVDYIPAYGLGPFDLVLSYTGGRALEQLRTRLGARRVAPLYGSVDPAVHKRVPPRSQYSSDLSYLGTYAADRQPQLEELFLKPARQSPDRKFCIGGALYPEDFPWSDNLYFVRHLPPAEHPAFYSSSRLTLNITRAAMAEMGYCPSARLFEAAACGTPIVSDDWEGLEQFFTPGQELCLARNSAEVAQWLALPGEELERMAAAARERVLDQHTAEHRARELWERLQETP